MALAIPGVLIAGSASLSVSSAVTIRYDDAQGVFRGSVDSPRPACERGRTVKVNRVRFGVGRVAGTDVTNGSGRYVVSKPNAHGRFYAGATRRVINGYNTTLICRADRSEFIRVGP
jgi:hypothetical protein